VERLSVVLPASIEDTRGKRISRGTEIMIQRSLFLGFNSGLFTDAVLDIGAFNFERWEVISLSLCYMAAMDLTGENVNFT